jgi:translation initiation factor 6 (eIF-6)
MTASRTQKWIELLVSNQTYVLARSQSLDDLKEDIESAVSSGGKFVDFTVSGDENVSLLVTAASHVVLVPQSRERGIRDTEVLDNPRGWSADY